MRLACLSKKLLTDSGRIQPVDNMPERKMWPSSAHFESSKQSSNLLRLGFGLGIECRLVLAKTNQVTLN